MFFQNKLFLNSYKQHKGIVMKKINVEDLLQYWGTTFIKVAYQCCFNTEPNANTIQYYLNKLDKGLDRIIVLEDMTNLPGSKITLDNITGAKQLFKKAQAKESIRKLFKPIKPVYWVLTEIKKQKSTERILLNRTYEIMSHLHGEPNLAPSLINKLSAMNTSLSFSITELSDEEQQKFEKILQQLK